MPAHAGSNPLQDGGTGPLHMLSADAATQQAPGPVMVLAQAAPVSGGAAADGASAGAVQVSGQVQPAAADWKQGPQRVGSLEIELLSDAQQVAPGERFRVGLRLRHDPHWHTYWRNPGDTGLPTRFELQGPEGTVYSDMVWPAPERLAIGNMANYGYEGEMLLYREVTLPADFRGRQARFQVNAEWLICRELCIPGEAALALEIPVGGSTRLLDAEHAAFEQTRRRAPEPGKAREVGWWQRDGNATLILPPEFTRNGQPRSALFLPYFEEVVRPVAEQRLVEINGEGEVRHGLALSLNEQAVRSAEAGWEQKGGMLVVDGGQPVEVRLQKLAVTPIAGKTLTVDKPREVELEAQPGAGGQGNGKGGLLGQMRLDGEAPRPSGDGGAAAPAESQAEGQASAAAPVPPAQSGSIQSLWLAVLAAFLGGIILNLMPCVFPVIGLKILSFTEAAGGKPGVARRHAMAFSLGVVATFVALAGLLIALRALGQAVGWGFQLQSPVFVAIMALMFVLIGLNLFGVFEAGASLTQLGGAGNGRQSGYRNSFMTGVMAVVVATPCTAPFMGSAVGFTLGSSAWEMLLVFAALGVGMAVPYLILASSDRLLTLLPRPGAWLQTFKQLLGFPMFLTAAWLVWVLALQTDAEGVLLLLLAAICLGFSAWVYGRWQFELRPKGARSTPAWLLAALLSVVACALLVSRLPVVADAATPSARAGDARTVAGEAAPACVPGPDGNMPADCVGWQPWSPERVAAARAAGQPVFVNFTAAWCLTCQVNKRMALHRPEVMKMFAERKVLLLEADWTRRDQNISAELARHGRNSVPFYLFYDGKSATPRQLPELLTVDVVRDALAG